MKKIVYSLLVILSIFLLNACSSSKDTGNMENITVPEKQSVADNQVLQGKDDVSNKVESTDGTKIITTANLQLETLDYEKAIQQIENITSNLKGYINSSNVSNNSIISNSQNSRYANYSIKIPREKYNMLIDELAKIGNIVYSTTESIDVTNEYRDTEARVKALQIREDRLMDLLSKAQKVSDIVTIEQELNNVIYEKEVLTGNLKQVDDKVNYTQVNLDITEVNKYNKRIGIKDSLLDKIKNTFISSINNLMIVLENLVLLIIWILPLLIIFVPIVFIVIFIFKKIKRKNK